MGILSGPEIINQIKAGRIVISPFSIKRVNSNSYNVRLAKTLVVYEDDLLDMKTNHKTKVIEIPEDGYILRPGKLYLGMTEEYTETYPPYVPMIEGRSSVGRLGLSIHACAGFCDTNFRGNLTLELSVIQPLRIYAGVEVGQIAWHQLVGEPKLYNGKYQGQTQPLPSGIWKELVDEREKREA
jgi:dCTP deaminase